MNPSPNTPPEDTTAAPVAVVVIPAAGLTDELRRYLEARVERRTEALSQANTDLQASLTRIQDMQRQLVESEKMASLGALVAGVAHEINTPIGVAVTAASFLREEVRRLQRAHR